MPEGTSLDTQPTGLTEAAAAARIESLLSYEEDTADSQPQSKSGTTSTSTPDATHEPRDESESQELDADESSDAPEGQEPEAESEQSDDESSDDSQQELPRYRVKIDGEELEVPLDELLRGYSRTQDYTRKTQAVSEQRKQLDSVQAEARADRERVAQQLTQLTEVVQAMTPAEPDWDKLRQEDPEGFPAAFAAYKLHQERVQNLQNAQREAINKVLADRQQEHEKLLQEERGKLLDVIPTWKDAEVAKKESTQMREYALKQGFTPEMLAGVTDHRVMVLLRKAMLYDRAEAAKPALQERIERVRSATPGSRGNARPPATKQTRMKQRLSQTHRVEDAAALIESMLPD